MKKRGGKMLHNRVKGVRIIGIIFSLFLVSGCRVAPSITFIFKEYSYEYYRSNQIELNGLKKACKDRRMIPEFISIDRKSEESIRRLIEGTKAPLIYLDPLLRESPLVFAKRYPAKLFFTLKRNIEGKNTSNLLLINFDRMKIMEQAGIAAGKILKEGMLDTLLPEKQTEEKQKKAGMILFPASEQVRKETSSFINGFTAAYDEDHFILIEVNDVNDKVKIKKELDDMKNGGVILFFFRVYAANIFCLEYLMKEGGYAILENADALSDFNNIVLFSINEDFTGSLDAVFKNIRRETKPKAEGEAVEWQVLEVNGKIEIKWGNVIPPVIPPL
jgi:hypothetical protein